MPHWTHDFAPFTLLHYASSALFLALPLAVVLLARRWRGTPRERRLRLAWVLTLVGWQTFQITWYLLPANFDLQSAFPLQICDLVPLLAIAAFATRRRVLFAVVYYWSLALATQAYITPTLGYGPANIHYYLFWITHAQIVGSALYPLAALDFRPAWRDCFTAIVALHLYGAVTIPLNIALNVNYGFLGESKPANPSIVDHLGPWPLRIVWIGLAACSAIVIVHLITLALRRVVARKNTGIQP